MSIFSKSPPFKKISYIKWSGRLLEIVFVGLCEVFVHLEFVKLFFFSLAAKLIGPFPECEFFKKI